MAEQKEILVTCPYFLPGGQKCPGILLRKGELLGIDTATKDIIRYLDRCPNCKKDVKVIWGVTIRTEIVY
jgi:hypothetical protein